MAEHQQTTEPETDVNTAFLRKVQPEEFHERHADPVGERIRHKLTGLVYLLPALLFRWLGFHIVKTTNQNRIGHLMAEPDWFIRKMEIGEVGKVRPILLLKPKSVANRAFLDILRQRYHVVENGLLRGLLKPLHRFPGLSSNAIDAVAPFDRAADYHRVRARSADIPSVWTFPDDIAQRAQAALADLGLPEGAWYVCVHSREGGYSPDDEYMHAHRNSHISSYQLAMDEIIARGGWCIRMGDASMAKLPDAAGVIDYPHSRWKSDWMDLYLGAHCRFFLGNTSGLIFTSSIFDIPSVQANMAPLATCYGPHPKDISLPKLVRDRDGLVMSFADVFGSEIANYRIAGLMDEAGLSTIDNTPEEIRDAVIEMFDQLDGQTPSPAAEKRQTAFRGLMKPAHYSVLSAARISDAFLRAHANLLPGAAETGSDDD